MKFDLLFLSNLISFILHYHSEVGPVTEGNKIKPSRRTLNSIPNVANPPLTSQKKLLDDMPLPVKYTDKRISFKQSEAVYPLSVSKEGLFVLFFEQLYGSQLLFSILLVVDPLLLFTTSTSWYILGTSSTSHPIQEQPVAMGSIPPTLAKEGCTFMEPIVSVTTEENLEAIYLGPSLPIDKETMA